MSPPLVMSHLQSGLLPLCRDTDGILSHALLLWLRCVCRWRSRRVATALASAGAQWGEGCCNVAGAGALLCHRLAGQT